MTQRQKRLTYTHWLLLATLGVSVCFAAWVFLPRTAVPSEQQSAGKERILPVEMMKLESTREFESNVSYTGQVVAKRTSALGFERLGKLQLIHVDLGDRVTKGQILAKLDTARLEAQKGELEAQISEAEAKLRLLIDGPRSERIAAAEANVQRLTAMHEVAKRDLERQLELYERKVTSVETLDRFRFNSRAAKAALDAAEEDFSELQNGSRPDEIAAQRARVNQLNAAHAAVCVDIENSEIEAPYSGTVAERLADEGTIASPNQTVVRIVESEFEAHIGLPIDEAAKIPAGKTVQIEIEGKDWTAICRGPLPELDNQSRTQTVVFELGNEEEEATAFVVGSLARLPVKQSWEAEGFVVPITSLARGQRGLWSLWATQLDEKGQGRVQSRDVEVLFASNERAFVRGTIVDGESIVVGGTHRLATGQQVRSTTPNIGQSRGELESNRRGPGK